MTTTTNFAAEQRAAITSDHSRILCLAGPGSGKTTTLLARLCRLIISGADPAGIVCITFTNAAAKDMAERLANEESHMGRELALGYIGTLHGFALRQLSRYGKALGYGERITVLDEQQAADMLIDVAVRLGAMKRGNDPREARKVPKKLQEARESLRRSGRPRTPAELAVASYLRELRAASACDFDTILDDFLRLAQPFGRMEAMEKGPPLPTIDHLFVDEYQDSGELDAAIYEALPALNRFLVGDPDQAIYSFRGGRVGNILELSRRPGVELHILEGNYRSGAAICQAANRLIGHNSNRVQKATAPALERWAGAIYGPHLHQTAEQELTNVIEEVAVIMEATAADDIAILCRTNALALEFTKAAESRGLPIRKKKPQLLPGDWALARAALDFLNAPRSDLTALQLLRAARGAEGAAQAKRLAAIEQKPVYKLLPTGIDEPPASWKKSAEALARLTVSLESIERIQEKAETLPAWDLPALCFAIARDLEAAPEWGSGITITTLHAAKGREWSSVFLPGCEQEICPGTAKTRDIEEERRLFFVGITRAKDRLFLSHAKSRRATWGQRRPQPCTPSQFLREIGA